MAYFAALLLLLQLGVEARDFRVLAVELLLQLVQAVSDLFYLFSDFGGALVLTPKFLEAGRRVISILPSVALVSFSLSCTILSIFTPS